MFSDGTRLGGGGVIPDEVVLPSGADLARRRDPALARAITVAGHAITPELARGQPGCILEHNSDALSLEARYRAIARPAEWEGSTRPVSFSF